MEKLVKEDTYYSLYKLILRVRHLMFKVREKELSAYGITGEQSGILYEIQANGRDTLAKLSWAMFREPHTISSIVSRMEKRGLLKKIRDQVWSNTIRLELTDKGRGAFESSVKRQSINAIMSSLSQQELEQLRLGLEKLFYAARQQLQRYYSPAYLLDRATIDADLPH